eukprot:Pgem_evm1s1002
MIRNSSDAVGHNDSATISLSDDESIIRFKFNFNINDDSLDDTLEIEFEERCWWEIEETCLEHVKSFAVFSEPSVKVIIKHPHPQTQTQRHTQHQTQHQTQHFGLVVSPNNGFVFVVCKCGCDQAFTLENWIKHCGHAF